MAMHRHWGKRILLYPDTLTCIGPQRSVSRHYWYVLNPLYNDRNKSKRDGAFTTVTQQMNIAMCRVALARLHNMTRLSLGYAHDWDFIREGKPHLRQPRSSMDYPVQSNSEQTKKLIPDCIFYLFMRCENNISATHINDASTFDTA